MSNLPDGCRMSDLPGWDDVDAVVEVECDNCHFKEEDMDIVLDKDGEGEWECPDCETTNDFKYPERDY